MLVYATKYEGEVNLKLKSDKSLCGIVILLDRQNKIENKAYKTKTIGPSVFTLIYFPDVGLSVFPDFGVFAYISRITQ